MIATHDTTHFQAPETERFKSFHEMTLEELCEVFKEEKLPKPLYYSLLLQRAEDIFSLVGREGKGATAKRLSMSPKVFSTFYPILVAHTTLMESGPDGASALPGETEETDADTVIQG